MQTHPDFIFHLDEPLEQPTTDNVPLRGWIAAQQPIGEVKLCGNFARSIASEERPDVQAAFPAFTFVAGFTGRVSQRDLRGSGLHFSFGADRHVVQALLPPPARPRISSRISTGAVRLLELGRLRVARDQHTRWHAALNALLLEIKLTRNSHFRRHESDCMLALFAEIFPSAVVVQIGANDGASGDPLGHLFSTTQWTGLLIEPVPFLAEALASRYPRRDNIHIEQVAISDRDGDALLYRLRTEPGITPQWFDQLATLNREVLLKHRHSIPEIESRIIEERIKTERLATLLQRHRLERVDLLMIDTEGHDYQILRDFDFQRFRPLLVIFEHQHLSSDDKACAYKLLRTNGYDHAETAEGDAVAWRLRESHRSRRPSA